MQEAIRRFHSADKAWQDRCLRFTLFHPAYWAYRTLREAIAAAAHEARGVLLDVGCGSKPYGSLFAPHVETYIGLEYGAETSYQGHRADLLGHAAALPLASASVETVLCTEVLEHLEDPRGALEEFYRVLKSGGLLMVTAPFAYPVHDERDYFRYSAKGIRVLLEGAGFVLERSQPLTGSGRTLALLTNIYVMEIGFFWTKWLYPLGLLLRPLLWVLTALVNLVGGLADFLLPSTHLAFNNLSIARKAP